MEVKKGTTDRSEYFHLRGDTDGKSKTGLLYDSAGAVASYVRSGGLRVNIPLVAMDADPSPDDDHVDGGFIEVDSTNAKGLYRLCVPDAAYAAGAEEVIIHIGFDGAFEESLRVTLVDNTEKDTYDRIGVPAGASLADDVAALPTNPVNVVSALSGTISVPSVKNGGTVDLYQNTAMAFTIELEKDMTGRKIYFCAVYDLADGEYAIPDGGTARKDVTGDANLLTGEVLLSFTAAELSIATGTLRATVQSDPEAGGDAVNEMIFKIKLRDHPANL